MNFIKDNNNIENTILSQYSHSGYCVINALTNLLKNNGLNVNLVDIQKKAKYFIELIKNDKELFKNILTSFYNENERFAFVKNISEEHWEREFNKFVKSYSKNVDCMKGNADWLIYALLHNMGYELKWINKQLHYSDIEKLHAKYGNFAFCISRHMSAFCNGNIVDFFNPFIHKEWKYNESGMYIEEREMRKNIEFIIYKR